MVRASVAVAVAAVLAALLTLVVLPALLLHRSRRIAHVRVGPKRALHIGPHRSPAVLAPSSAGVPRLCAIHAEQSSGPLAGARTQGDARTHGSELKA